MTRFTTLFQSTTFRVAGAVAALAVAAPLVVPADAAENITPIRCDGRANTVDGPTSDWQRFPAPTFQPGLGLDNAPQEITSYAVDPRNTNRVIITNGKSVYTSPDAGCSWTLGFVLDRVPDDPTRIPLSGLLTTIKFVYVVDGTYFAVAEELEDNPAVGRPHVLRSETGRPASWQLADEGLPPIGTPLAMRATKDGSVVYLTFSGAREESRQCPPAPLPCQGGGGGRRLGLIYASRNGGVSWQPRSDAGDLDSASAIKYISVDDDNPNGDWIWVVANDKLRKSENGGASFFEPDGLQQGGFTFTAVESLAQSRASFGLEVVAFGLGSDGAPGMIRLHKGIWRTTKVPFHAPPDSIAQRPLGDIAVATEAAGGMPQIWRAFPQALVDRESDLLFVSTSGWESITPARKQQDPVSADLASGSAATGAPTYFLRESKAILRFMGSTLIPEDVLAAGGDIVPPAPPLGRITPSTLTLDLPVGKSRTVDYTLTLPPSPTPLDVYFLVDNSGSMRTFINELKGNLRDIALALHETGVNVGIGVGSINVQPAKDEIPIDNPTTPNVDESKPRPIYEKLRAIGPVNAELFRALSKLAGTAGPGDEPQLEALYQAVHGFGLDFEVPYNYLDDYAIQPDQHAEFRDELQPIKVIVHATDENFTGTPDKTGERKMIRGAKAHNDIESVATALREANVEHIGLAVDFSEESDALKDLREMSKQTRTVAPPGGTDCDGDGRIGADDVRAGQPLVCGQGEGLDKTLVNLLQALSDPQTITLSKKPSPTMAGVSREEFRIDAKQSTKVRFSVTYSCVDVAPGEYVNDLSAALRGGLIAKATATVNCDGPQGRAGRPPRELPIEEPAANPPPIQPQPIVPAPVPVNPIPQPQTQVQTQTQVNPQAGMADQEEQQFQLASVTNDLRDDGELAGDQLAMSGLSPDDAALRVLGAGMVMAAGFGVGLATRRRHRTAVARVRTRRF